MCTSEVNSRGPTETLVGFEGRNVVTGPPYTEKIPTGGEGENGFRPTPDPSPTAGPPGGMASSWSPGSTQHGGVSSRRGPAPQHPAQGGVDLRLEPLTSPRTRTDSGKMVAGHDTAGPERNIPAPAVVTRPSVPGMQGTLPQVP